MLIVGQDEIGSGETKHYGIRFTNRLTDVLGNAVTISGTPTVSGTNCTVTYLSNSNGIVAIRVVPSVTTTNRNTAKALATTTVTLSNGEVIPVGINLTIV